MGLGFVINSLGINAAIAAGANVYAVFLGTMCLVAMGIVMLQNVANPYVMVLGSPEKGAFRMTLSQALNSVATTVASVATGTIAGRHSGTIAHLTACLLGAKEIHLIYNM